MERGRCMSKWCGSPRSRNGRPRLTSTWSLPSTHCSHEHDQTPGCSVRRSSSDVAGLAPLARSRGRADLRVLACALADGAALQALWGVRAVPRRGGPGGVLAVAAPEAALARVRSGRADFRSRRVLL